MSKIPHRLYLTEDQMPQKWFNLRSAMAEQPDPLLHPGTLRPLGVDDLSPIFCEELARQELDGATAYVDIPEPIQNVYKMYRPSPLIRAYELEKALDTPARIYYKFEGNNTSGSHKLNSAVAQAYYAKMQGLTGVTTETGAGQWGTALSEACSYFGLTCDVFMVKCSYEQKPFRKAVMNVFDASITPSPSPTTEVGRQILRDHPETTGSLGCAISEAVESAVQSGGAKRYVLGSVLNQVLLHQSIIGLESKLAMEQLGEYPDGGGLRRRRLQPGRADRPLYGRQAAGDTESPHRGGGTSLLPLPHPGQVRLRFLRHRPGHSPSPDVYPWLRLHPLRQPRRRPALPRHEPHPLQALPRRLYGGGGL